MKTKLFQAVTLMLLLTVSTTVWALDSLNVRRVARCRTGEQAYDIKMSGNFAYIADDDNGLRVLNISDVNNPMVVGSYDTPGWAQGIYVQDTIAYIADRNSGLRILNIANPFAPDTLGLYMPTGTTPTVRGVFVRDTIAYVACDPQGLKVVSVADPRHPREIGGLNPTPSMLAYSIKVVDTVAYVAASTAGLYAISISNPATPTLLGRLVPAGSERYYDVVIDSNKAFLAVFNTTFAGTKQRIVNVENPAAMTLVDSLAIGSCRGLVKRDTLIYYANADSGLSIVSYQTGARMSLVGFNHKMYSTGVVARAIAIRDSFAYVAADSAGLVIYNFGNIFHPQTINITSPTMRDTIHSRDYFTAHWNSLNIAGNVRIQISRSSPVSWITLGEVPITDTSFTWRVYNLYNLSATPCIMRIQSVDDTTLFGTSNFQIRPPLRPITITSPAGGEVWEVGTTHTIRWINSDSIMVTVGTIRNNRSARFGTTTADSMVWTVTNDTASAVYMRIAQLPDSFYVALSQMISIRPTAVTEPGIIREFRLDPAFPNPFNPTTTIRFAVPKPCRAQFQVYNLLGSMVAENSEQITAAGEYAMTLHGENWSSGVYLVRAQIGEHAATMKLVLLK